MATFNTFIQLNGKEYEASISGYHQKFERGTLESPEVKESFDIEKIVIYPDNRLVPVDLMDLRWLCNDNMLEEIEKDYFNVLKGEDYD